MKAFCAAADWGTSRFRLWLLAEDGSILEQTESEEGLKASAEKGFATVLEGHLDELGADRNLPVVICGMAGSRNGWAEARYIDTPARLDQMVKGSIKVESGEREVRILPGIAQRNTEKPDVIRGEETQLYGMQAFRNDSSDDSLEYVCMPGTHSKWVELEADSVKRFSTFMTGEMFMLLSKYSVLRVGNDANSDVKPDDPAFLGAVKAAINNPAEITNKLFSMRASQLLGFTSADEGLAGISGSLIGLELAGATSLFSGVSDVLLLAGGNMAELYEAALQSAGIRVTQVDAKQATVNGLYHAARAQWPISPLTKNEA